LVSFFKLLEKLSNGSSVEMVGSLLKKGKFGGLCVMLDQPWFKFSVSFKYSSYEEQVDVSFGTLNLMMRIDLTWSFSTTLDILFKKDEMAAILAPHFLSSTVNILDFDCQSYLNSVCKKAVELAAQY